MSNGEKIMNKYLKRYVFLLMLSLLAMFFINIPVSAATPSKPTITVVKKSADTSVWIRWAKAKNAKKYELYCSSNGGAYKLLTTTTKLYYKHTNLKNGKIYRYKVRAVNATAKSKFSAVKKYIVPKKAVLKTSDESVFLTAGSSVKKITITYTGENALGYESTDENIVECHWDETYEDYRLIVRGIAPGNAKIIVKDGGSLKLTIYVTVEGVKSNDLVDIKTSLLMVKNGETKTVTVTTDNGCEIASYVSNDNVTVEKIIQDSNIFTLYLTGRRIGETELMVYDKTNHNVKDKITISIIDDEKSYFDRIIDSIKSYKKLNAKYNYYINKTEGNETVGVSYDELDDLLIFSHLYDDGVSKTAISMKIKRSQLNEPAIEAEFTTIITTSKTGYNGNIYINKKTYTTDQNPTIKYSYKLDETENSKIIMDTATSSHFKIALLGWDILLLEKTETSLRHLGFKIND